MQAYSTATAWQFCAHNTSARCNSLLSPIHIEKNFHFPAVKCLLDHGAGLSFTPDPFESPHIPTQKKDTRGCPLRWRRGRDSLSPAGSVRVGSDSPPDCHSLPTRSNPLIYQRKKRTPAGVLALAEREGFEPSCGFPQTDFESAPL